jgi:hypothetical protein
MISVPDDFLEKDDEMHLSLFLFRAISFTLFTTKHQKLALKI